MPYIYKIQRIGTEDLEFIESEHDNVLKVWSEIENLGHLKGRRLIPTIYDTHTFKDVGKGRSTLIPRHAISMISEMGPHDG